jgi:lysozyme family protein
MADFDPIFEEVLGHEGGYSNDRVDRGGETYRGVARNSHPDWLGWGLVDSHRNDDDFPACLDTSISLQREVMNVYRREYWDRIWGDGIDSQPVAQELFDTAVNMGVFRAVCFLQQSLNALNRDGRLYLDIAVDGGFGPNTRQALDVFLRRDQPAVLLVAMNVLQGAHYLAIMRADTTQERFARGWLMKRVRLFTYQPELGPGQPRDPT